MVDLVGFTCTRSMSVSKMYVCISVALALVVLGNPIAYGQIERPTFQETAQIIVDGIQSSTITASIVLQSTDTDEINLPLDLVQRIHEEPISSIVITTHNNCILGVMDKLCVLVNLRELPSNSDDIRSVSSNIGSRFIDDINDIFQTDAKFHSVFIHSNDQPSQVLNTTGAVSGRGIISVVYTMPREDASLSQKMTDTLLSDEIRSKGGLYDITNILYNKPDLIETFSIIPLESNLLMQLKLSIISPINISEITRIDPLDHFGVDEMSRTLYLDTGFYQLNSLVHLVVLSPTDISVSDVQGYEIPTRLVDGQEIPTDITKPGWIFDSKFGSKIEAKYLFGDDGIIKQDDLILSIRVPNDVSDDPSDNATENEQVESPKSGSIGTLTEQYVVVIVIALVGAAATIFYIKGYKRS